MTITVIDDARIVREGLKKIIRTQCPEFTVVGEASDGQKGFELLQETRPDICIVDMRMPRMHGTEMVEKIRALGITTKFIVVSGYPDFEYAQRMMAFGGCVAYLLKPIDHTELVTVLHREYELSIKKKPEQGSVNSNQINKLIAGSLTQTDLLASSIEMAGIISQHHALGILRIDYQIDKSSMFETIYEHVSSLFPPAMLVAHPLDSSSILVILATSGQKEAETLLRSISISIKKKYSQSISIGAALCEGIHGFPSAFQEAKLALESGFHSEPEAVNWECTSQTVEEQPLFFILEEHLFRALTMETHDVAAAKLTVLLETMKEFSATKDFCRLIIQRMFNMMVKILSKQGNTELLQLLPKTTELQEQLELAPYFSDFEAHVQPIITALISFSKQSSTFDTSKRAALRKILRYMDDNYDKDLSLSRVAKIARMTPSYFSSYFKKEMGETYIYFLNKMKIERAKELLQDPNIKIHEIAVQLGFGDGKYFSRKFKNHVGVSPNQYRNSTLELIGNT